MRSTWRQRQQFQSRTWKTAVFDLQMCSFYAIWRQRNNSPSSHLQAVLRPQFLCTFHVWHWKFDIFQFAINFFLSRDIYLSIKYLLLDRPINTFTPSCLTKLNVVECTLTVTCCGTITMIFFSFLINDINKMSKLPLASWYSSCYSACSWGHTFTSASLEHCPC